MGQARVLTARRALEFKPDDLRLSVLCTPQVQQQIGQLFNFQVVQIGTPLQTFGVIPATLPPGLIFDYGAASTSEGEVPIRFLHFEPYRIVLDVAAGTSTIEQVYDQLQQTLDQIRDLDGFPVVGKPANTSDYSEISMEVDFDLDQLLSEPVRRIAQDTFAGAGDLRVFPANISFLIAGSSQEIQQMPPGPSLQVRAGTTLEDRVCLSTAFLSTDKHISWLETLNDELASR